MCAIAQVTKQYENIGDQAVIKVTGLSNPGAQLDAFQPSLMSVALNRDEVGRIVRKAGIMSVVVSGGIVKIGDRIRAELPPQPY
ncbi:MAG: hypothetical protein ACRC80_08965 [Waterburya sp.]